LCCLWKDKIVLKPKSPRGVKVGRPDAHHGGSVARIRDPTFKGLREGRDIGGLAVISDAARELLAANWLMSSQGSVVCFTALGNICILRYERLTRSNGPNRNADNPRSARRRRGFTQNDGSRHDRRSRSRGSAEAGDVGTASKLAEEGYFDLAILDVNLNGKLSFPVADIIMGRRIPLIFATGYAADSFPDAYRTTPRLQKPFLIDALARAITVAVDLPPS
jgi:hypothetical protein